MSIFGQIGVDKVAKCKIGSDEGFKKTNSC